MDGERGKGKGKGGVCMCFENGERTNERTNERSWLSDWDGTKASSRSVLLKESHSL